MMPRVGKQRMSQCSSFAGQISFQVPDQKVRKQLPQPGHESCFRKDGASHLVVESESQGNEHCEAHQEE